jgi:hypothetical protein
MERRRSCALVVALGTWWALRGAGGRAVRSVEAQTFAFFARPHAGLPTTPLVGPSVWDGAELAAREGDWREVC